MRQPPAFKSFTISKGNRMLNKMGMALLSAALPVWAQTSTLNDFTIDSISSTSWRMKLSMTGPSDHNRLLYSVAPADCRQPNTAQNPVSTDPDIYTAGAANMNTSGKAPSTVYNVCPQIHSNGVWVGSLMQQLRTLDAPGGNYVIPQHAQRVNTDYPTDIVSGNFNPVSVTNCSNLYQAISDAIKGQTTTNTVISLTPGQANGCLSTIYFDQTPPDVLPIATSAVNTDGSLTIPSHGWSDGQALVFARTSDYSSDIPSGLQLDGRLYYVKVKDANTIYVYDQPPARNGQPIPIGPNAYFCCGAQQGQPNPAGQFNLVPYPRHLKNIILRPATPDDQFAAPGTALGGLQWTPKMAWFLNIPAHHRFTTVGAGSTLGYPTVSFGDQNGDSRRQSLIANLRFVGIAFTMQDDPQVYTTTDPPAWPMSLPLPPTTQNIIVDRCAFFAPNLQHRVYTTLNFQGINSAVINSYFDKTNAYFYPQNTNGFTVYQPGSSGGIHQ